MREALARAGMTEAQLNHFDAAFVGVAAAAHAALGGKEMFRVSSGVLQGCPLSGLYFVLATDGGLRHLQRELREHSAGLARACADDLGAILLDIAGLEVMRPFFADAQAGAGLTLKPKKCQIALVAGPVASHAPGIGSGTTSPSGRTSPSPAPSTTSASTSGRRRARGPGRRRESNGGRSSTTSTMPA